MRTCTTLVLFSLLLLLVPALYADDLADIQDAIRESGAQWTADHNPIWDLPHGQRQILLGWDRSLDEAARPELPEPVPSPSNSRLPEYFDWRDIDGESYITPITDQQQCGSCWAFGAVACMESRLAIDGFIPFPTLDLSEQFLVSCSPGSCNGYSLSGTCEFLQQTGTPMESCMTYRQDDTIPCSNSCPHWDMEALKIQDWGWNPSGNRDAIKEKVLEGPVYVAFTVYEDFQAYTGGVYEHTWGDYDGGHAVALVGWDDSLECWILKNSWGPGWGENGYFRMKYGQCGMEEWTAWLTVATPTVPNLSIVDVEITELDGDGDGVVNPGERASLAFTIANNIYWSSAYGLTLSLSVPELTRDRISIVEGSFTTESTIAPGESLHCQGGFVIDIADGGPVDGIPMDLVVGSNEGTGHEYEKSCRFDVVPSLSMPGWPFMGTTQFYSGPACFELSDSMVIAVADRDGVVWLLDADGNSLPGWPVEMGDMIRSAPSIADLDGDGLPEIVMGTRNDLIAALKIDGTPLLVEDVGNGVTASVMLTDLNGDEIPEMIAGDTSGNLWALDAEGNDIEGWPLDLDGPILASTALLPEQELICAGARSGNLFLIGYDGTIVPGWPVDLDGDIQLGPVIADYDDDGSPEIICAASRTIYAVELDGSATELFTSTALVKSGLLTLDMDGNRLLDVVFATSDGKVHAISPDGSQVIGWPRTIESSSSAGLAAAELDSDGIPEIICTTDRGYIYFFDGHGYAMDPAPIVLGEDCLSPPALADLDGDGDLEIVVGMDGSIQVIDHKMLDTRAIWPTHRADNCRLGYYLRDTLGIESGDPSVKPQFSILSVAPTPSSGDLTITMSAPTSEEVSVSLFDIAGRRYHASQVNPEIGVSSHRLSLHSTPPGIYLLQLKTGETVRTSPVLILR